MSNVDLNLIPVDETQLVIGAGEETQLVLGAGDDAQLVVNAGDETQLVLSAGDNTQIVLSSVPVISNNGLMLVDGTNSDLALGNAGIPSLKFNGDANTGIFSPGADQVSISTGGTERLRVDGAGQIEAVSLGSAAAPTFSFTGDPNTGIYSPGADQLAISTNGTGRLFVDASGNVAILQPPSSAPSFTKTFNISASNASIALRGSSGGAYTDQGIFFAVDGTNYSQIYNDGIGQLIFRTGSGLSERLRITSAGNVGIGTSSPGSLLNLAHPTAADIRLTVGSTLQANIYSSSSDTNIFSVANNPLILGTNNTERLRITSGGLVGIGTSTVQAGHTLQVNGIIASVTSFGAFTALQAAGGTGFRWALANDGTFRLQRTTDGFASAVTTPLMIDASSRVGIGTTSPAVPLDVVGQIRSVDGTVDTRLQPLSASSAAIAGTWSNHAYVLYTNNTERLRISTAGNVGIGTSSPGYKLDVAGSGSQVIRSLTTDTSGFAVGAFRAEYLGGGGGTNTAIELRAGDTYSYLLTTTNHPIAFGINSTERARIDSSGRLGLGTSNPIENFHVQSGDERKALFTNTDFVNTTTGTSLDVAFGATTGNTFVHLRALNSGRSAWGNLILQGGGGRVGIGTTAPENSLHVLGTVQINTGAVADGLLIRRQYNNPIDLRLRTYDDSTKDFIFRNDNGTLRFIRNATEVAQLDSSGRLLVGTSAARTTYLGAGISAGINVEAAGNLGANNRSISLVNGYSVNTDGDPCIYLGRTRSDTVGGTTIVQNNDGIGRIAFVGSDGTNMLAAAQIRAEVDGTPGANDMPGRLVFSTTADGASSPTERLRITSAGRVGIGTASPGHQLDVSGSGGQAIRAITTDTSGVNVGRLIAEFTGGGGGVQSSVDLRAGNGYSYLVNTTNTPLLFGTNSVERARLDAAGGFRVKGAGTAGSTDAFFINGSAPASSFVLDSAGRVGIGTTSPGGRLQINIQDGFLFDVGAGAYTYMRFGSQTTAEGVAELAFDRGAGAVALKTGSTGSTLNTRLLIDAAGATIINNQSGTERARIDSSGNLLVGTSVSQGTGGSFQVGGSSAGGAAPTVGINAFGFDGRLRLSRATNGSPITIVASGDRIGRIAFDGYDGATYREAATVAAEVDGTPGSGDMPGRIVLATTADGAPGPTERMRIDSAGRVGIGTTGPTEALQVANGNILIGTGGSSAGYRALYFGGTTATGRFAYIEKNNDSPFDFNIVAQTSLTPTSAINFKTTPTSTAATIDSSGRLLVGTSASTNFIGTAQPAFLQLKEDANNFALGLQRASNDSAPPNIAFRKTRATTDGGVTVVADGDTLGQIRFIGTDGTGAIQAATIRVDVDGTPGTNDMPGRVVLATTADGATTPTERFRITNDGVIAHDQPAPAAVNATATLTIANLKTGIITSTSAAATDMTLPTGTDTQAGFSGTYDNFTFEWSVINTGPSLVRVLAGTAHTIVGSGSVATGTSGRFASRRTAANTFVTYRLT